MRSHHLSTAALVAHGGTPFSGEILAALEAGRVIEQKVRVAGIGEGDVPVRVGQRERLGGSTGAQQMG